MPGIFFSLKKLVFFLSIFSIVKVQPGGIDFIGLTGGIDFIGLTTCIWYLLPDIWYLLLGIWYLFYTLSIVLFCFIFFVFYLFIR